MHRPRTLLFLLFFLTATLTAQTTVSLIAVDGQKIPFEVAKTEVRNGELVLYRANGTKEEVDPDRYPWIHLGRNDRFRYLNHPVEGQAQSGYFRQLTGGDLVMYDIGNAYALAEDPNSDRLIVVPLNDNKDRLTYLFKNCPFMTEVIVQRRNTNGLKNLLSRVQEYNDCIDPTTSEFFYTKEEVKGLSAYGIIAGARITHVLAQTNRTTPLENYGYNVSPTVGLSYNLLLPRSKVGAQVNTLLTYTDIEQNDVQLRFPNDMAREDFRLTYLTVAIQISGVYQIRPEGPLSSVRLGFVPRFDLTSDLKRNPTGYTPLAFPVGKKAFNAAALVGATLYKKAFDNGGSISLEGTYDVGPFFIEYPEFEQRYLEQNITFQLVYYLGGK